MSPTFLLVFSGDVGYDLGAGLELGGHLLVAAAHLFRQLLLQAVLQVGHGFGELRHVGLQKQRALTISLRTARLPQHHADQRQYQHAQNYHREYHTYIVRYGA